MLSPMIVDLNTKQKSSTSVRMGNISAGTALANSGKKVRKVTATQIELDKNLT